MNATGRSLQTPVLFKIAGDLSIAGVVARLMSRGPNRPSGFLLTSVEQIAGYMRKSSLWPAGDANVCEIGHRKLSRSESIPSRRAAWGCPIAIPISTPRPGWPRCVRSIRRTSRRS